MITPGQRHDSTQLGWCLPAFVFHGREGADDLGPAQRGSSPTRATATRAVVVGSRERQNPHTIPERRDQRDRRATRPGRPLAFNKAIYAPRNVVERCINRLKQWRGLSTRYEKRAANYRAMVVIASIVIWLQS